MRIVFGLFVTTLAEQIKEQGFKLKRGTTLQGLQKAANASALLYAGGYINKASCERAQKKILRLLIDITKHI